MPAKSKAQQRFMGMVRATQKGEMKDPPEKVEEAAKSMKKKDVKDFAKTKHDKLPEKKTEKEAAFVRGVLSAYFTKMAEEYPEKQEQLKDFLQITPDTEDKAVHAFADSIDMDADDAEMEIYELAKKHLGDRSDDPMEKLDGGLADGEKPDAPKDEEGAGITVEMEHTDDPEVAKEITDDHLAEDPEYYSKLKAMEEGACDDEMPETPYKSDKEDEDYEPTEKEAAFIIGFRNELIQRGLTIYDILDA